MVSGVLTSSMGMPSAATLFLGRPRHSLDHSFTRNNLAHNLLHPSNVLLAPVVTILSRSGATVKTRSRGWRKRHLMGTQIGCVTLRGRLTSVCQGVILQQHLKFVIKILFLDFSL